MAEIIRSGAPTKFTVGRVNDIYIDSISGRRYVLVSIHKIVVMNGTVTTYEWDEIGTGDSCSHTNLTTLDKLSEDPSGNLLFDGSQIKGDGSGVDGKDGADGKSAYQIAVDLGFEGDEATWLESLKGEKGETGEQGPQGEKGADGTMTFEDLTDEQKESLRGPQGIQGEKGEKGDTGEVGPQGETGPAGEAGKDGVTYTPMIGTVTTGDTVSASVDVDETAATATFNFTLPAGSGESGADGKSAYQIAVDRGFEGDEAAWLESLKGEQGETGAEGRSMTAVNTDGNNNVIATFSDGATETIGNIDVQADFLTSGGFGKLRFQNGVFQYYDENLAAWVDVQATINNTAFVNITPQPMRKFVAVQNLDVLNNVKLYIEEPLDTIVDNQALCILEKVIIRRKKGSVPVDENDGVLVLTIGRSDFGKYTDTPYEDTIEDCTEGDTYYYKAFPVSSAGNVSNMDANTVSCTLELKTYHTFGFKLDQNESDPASMITYLEDCDNATFQSAYMDFETGTFNYGDWADAWFIRDLKPVMLKYDGSVDYELDKNDYTKKADGTDSDVANTDYEGNAMVGIPKVYWKIVDNGDNTANIYIANRKWDDEYVCWSHIDNNGNEIDYCYMGIYNGTYTNSVLRSLSGCTLGKAKYADEITYALANNTTEDVIWYGELYSDRTLINLLLLLIGKSTDTQAVFGIGNCDRENSADSYLTTGTMNTNGMFYGSTDNTLGVKVFGMEHWWGNQGRRVSGLFSTSAGRLIKMTYGQHDGSTVDGYNLTGEGYIQFDTPKHISDYIKNMVISENGLLPDGNAGAGSSTTYYPDHGGVNTVSSTSSDVYFYTFGGSCVRAQTAVGAFTMYYNYITYSAITSIGTSLSCKPLATT